MVISPARKVFLILLLSSLASAVALPKTIPISLSLGPIKIDKTFTRRSLNLNLGKIQINTDLPLVLGLDLAGGSHLVFEADTTVVGQERKAEALEGLKDVIERRVNLFGVSEPNIQVSSFEGKDRIIVELPGVKNTGEAIGLIGQTAQLAFVEISGTDVQNQLYSPTDLTGADLKSAKVTFDSNSGSPVVSIEFTQVGADKFAVLTERNVGKPLPILLDGELITAPIVQEKITGGQAVISGDFGTDEARLLSIQLNAGALPVPINLVEQRTVGATLGEESIQKSVRAGLAGLFMVGLFMILTYGKLGLVADFALIIFGVLTLALYKLIPVVLTLPGIAGFLLSVGMAVDSNILIFERFKEEIKRREVADALEVSFGRAWDSIRDANIATLVTAFILANPLDFAFLHTSGPVRGFAITLALGIAVSLFTGIIVSRNLLRVFIKEHKYTGTQER
ncbi:protein-export membrane protein SecD [Candidatus Woesebacteria bacterium GWB1_43_5]|uniref:Protein translocase subunit SecD n=1 Tax=Candidatus Woesebacteria bacterium GWB1_43_5 TaxID=1802474 RepID=A0A1F7WSQ3_9BACT|nr:MAG: protein-export membrane protein SecD [Candidatus Woesebacteria bacterium GWB1_43_5]